MSTLRRRVRRRLAIAAAVASAVTGIVPSSALATTYYWDTTTTGLWSNGANWSDTATTGGTTGVVPGAADIGTFNQSSVNGAETVQFSGAQSALGLVFGNTGTTLLDANAAGTQTLSLGTSGTPARARSPWATRRTTSTSRSWARRLGRTTPPTSLRWLTP